MHSESSTGPGRDAQTVSAVRNGDVERYRELVERHERRVFAVAWSRLGDAALAEEATQEAFIRGYRRLWLLGDGAKFAGWITAIARHAAINLGLRHRRELNKRERWALEQTDAQETPAADACPPETLRQTLEELPAAHRECLVLFYLEGRSGAEAAAALGISEAAFRVRLHRARGALREQLENKLAGSLEKLRPAKSLVPSVMGAILISSPAKVAGSAGVGLKGLSWLLPFKFFSLIFLIPMLPGLALGWMTTRMDQRNYRDAAGFRARLHRQSYGARIWVMVAILALGALLYFCMPLLATAEWDTRRLYLVGAAWLLGTLFFSVRRLAIRQNRFDAANLVAALVLTVGCLAIGLERLPMMAFFAFMVPYGAALAYGYGSRPMRMDYNLFLRASQNMLPITLAATGSNPTGLRLDKARLRAFARQLGNRWLVVGHRWKQGGLVLKLPPLKTFRGHALSRPGSSSLRLGWDGSVSAHLGEKDEEALLALQGRALPGRAELENQVAAAVNSAWQRFREGNIPELDRMLGEVADADVFIVPPARSKSVRWMKLTVLIGFAPLLVFGTMWFFNPTWLSGLKPVSVTGAEVRAFLNDTTPNPDPKLPRSNRASLALFNCLVLPPTNLFSPGALRAMRDEVAGGEGFDSSVDSMKSGKRDAGWVFYAPLPRFALACGWIRWNEVGIQPEDAAAFLHTNRFPIYSPDKWDRFLARCEAWSWVKQERFEVMRIESGGLKDLRLLRSLNCLDLVGREKLIQQIASVQVLSGTPPGQPPMHDWRDVRGLFFTPCFPALQDTYFSLAALEILGGLDKIDREACIQGILQQHHGKGYFESPDSGGENEYHIRGDVRDTFSAFESLRILGALDRVKDLESWQFRPERRGRDPKVTVDWDVVEAWVCQQRFAEILRERKANPQAPVRSLLQP